MEVGPHELDRFLVAQHQTHEEALAEISAGQKVTHWMWWEFPQLRGLGRSHRAMHYGIENMEEATRFMAHPVLGPHLVELAEAMLEHAGTPPEDVLGSIDGLKLRSCATLFAHVPDAPNAFRRILDVFFDGRECGATREKLGL